MSGLPAALSEAASDAPEHDSRVHSLDRPVLQLAGAALDLLDPCRLRAALRRPIKAAQEDMGESRALLHGELQGCGEELVGAHQGR